MPTYVLPQVLVFQDFAIVPQAAANPLRAHISGGNAQLIRYAQTSEREKGLLGYYDRVVPTPYLFPNRPAGGIVDKSYVKLWAQNAILPYFADPFSGGSMITKTAGYSNRIRSATVNFRVNGIYARDAVLLDRDVKVGDIAKVRALNNLSQPITLWTYVKDILGDIIPSAIGAATSDIDNPASQAAASSVVQTGGDINCVQLTPDIVLYNGLLDGFINETYDIVVLESSVGGLLETAKIRILSGSGLDNVVSMSPQPAHTLTSIGSRGLRVNFNPVPSVSCSASATAESVSPDDLIVGQRWRVTVQQAFTKPVPTSGGTYAGSNDTSYIVEVRKGGLWADKPTIVVTTVNGIDISGPTQVTAPATLVTVGTLGVQIEFSGLGLRHGDRYYIPVTGAAQGPMRTIVLGNNLDVAIPDGAEIDLTLFILKPLIQITQDRTGFPPLLNWTINDEGTEITVNDGIIAYDESWTNGGVPQPLDVWSESSKGYGLLFVEYRAWLSDLCHSVGTINDVGTIEAQIPGPLDPDNPLKWGVFKALENANGTDVKFTSVCDPSLDSNWADVLGLLLGRDDVYGLVPLTRKRTVLDLYAAHVKDQSSPENGLWRVLWTNLAGVPEIPVVAASSTVPNHEAPTTLDGQVCLATVTDDPQEAGSQFTIVRCTSHNSGFLHNGVRAGDIVRMLYTGDGFGNFTYSEFVVDAVTSEDELRLLVGPAAPINVGAKIEVWRNLSATEEATEIATTSGSWGDRRIRSVWPDQIEAAGTIMEGYFLCCSLSGLSSGILPHQGMTNLEIVGYTNVQRTTGKFNKPELDIMALAGTWIVTQDLSPTSGFLGQIYTRHAVTTGLNADINQREEVVTRNVDSISYRFKDWFRPFIGVTNVVPVMQSRLLLEAGKLISTLQTEAQTSNLGGQLLDGTVVNFIRPSALFKDRFVMSIGAVIPYPFNNAEIHIVI